MNQKQVSDNGKPVIVVDGRRLAPQATGVGRYLSLLLNHWASQPEELPFAPFVVQHQPRSTVSDTWKSAFPHEIRGTNQPGWIWENFALASSELRELPLFASANLVPYRWKGPVLLVVHDTFCEYQSSGISRINRLRFRGRYRRAAERADVIIVPSQSTANDVHRFFGIPQNRIQVVRPGLPDDFRPNIASIESSRLESMGINMPYLLFVGKKSPRRRFDQILIALQKLNQLGAPLQLVSVGPVTNEFQPVKGWLDLGHVSDDLLIQIYQNALALVWPSSLEGFGLPVAEAMACGCPVLTTSSGAILEIIGNNYPHLSSANADEIVELVSKILSNSNLRIKMREAGLVQIQSFRVKRFADSVASHIVSLTNQATNGRRSFF